MLESGDRGRNVDDLQANLAKLGYTDACGHKLRLDSDFGPNTRFAVEAFQRDHHLDVDGKVGPHTQQALALVTRNRTRPSLDSAEHAGSALYREAQQAVYAMDRHIGRMPDRQSDQLAGAAAVAAHVAGLEHITEITLSKDGSRAFAVQAGTLLKLAHVQTAAAVSTSLMQSSQEWSQQVQETIQQVKSAAVEQTPARSASPMAF